MRRSSTLRGRRKNPFALSAWLPLMILPALVLLFFPRSLPLWALMWTLAVAIYAGCKWLSWSGVPLPPAPLWKHAAYLFLWPGMHADAFLRPAPQVIKAPISEWIIALLSLLFGLVLLNWAPPLLLERHPLATGWVGMIAVSMIFHFGMLHLLSCFWRAVGVNARPLMVVPIATPSVTDFWGRRWNMAFRDLTYIFLLRPLAPYVGVRKAMLIVFLFSALVHDVGITIPSGGGYGLPSLYFIIQGAALGFERSKLGVRIIPPGHVSRRAFAWLVIACPGGLLFHKVFVMKIVLPFIRALGAFTT